MMQSEKMNELLERNKGILQTAQALDAGISKQAFYGYVKAYGLERICHGVYAAQDAWVDTAYILHLRCRQAVFSHDSALFFHELTDREPTRHSLTVKSGYNPSKLQADGFRVFTVKESLHSIGLTDGKTPFGHTVPVYDMERTICDLLRSRSRMETQELQTALREYVRKKEKNLQRLMQYAPIFGVEKLLRQYLEVLLV